MTAGEVVVTVVVPVALGGLLAWYITRYYYVRGGAKRPSLVLKLEESARVDEATVGIDLSLRVGGYDVKNLSVFTLTATNSGPADIVVSDPEGRDLQAQRPEIHLPMGFRVLISPFTLGGALPRADVRVARSISEDGVQRLHVHVHRLGSGEVARVTIVCSYRANPAVSLVPTTGRGDFPFEPGFIEGVRVQPDGLLRRPPLLGSRS